MCTGVGCISGNKWYWIGSNGVTSLLALADLSVVRDMVSSGIRKFDLDLIKRYFLYGKIVV